MRFPQILLMPAAVATVSTAGAYVLVTPGPLLMAVIVTAAGVVGNVTTVAKQGLFIVIVNGN
jgi:hypothetical protein